MIRFQNSKKQGDWGLGRAIAYFTLNEKTVSIPLTESQDYDLIIDEDSSLKKVQVKTSIQISRKTHQPIVHLRTCGGNQSFNYVKKFDISKIDYVFVTTEKFGDYLIPTLEIKVKNTLTLDSRFDKFKVVL
jgi:hypothetical protein